MSVRMTKRQKLAHGFMLYIENVAMRDIQYEVGRAAEARERAEREKNSQKNF